MRGDTTAAASQHAMEASAEAAPALAQLSPASKNRKRSAQKKESKLKKKMDRYGVLYLVAGGDPLLGPFFPMAWVV